MRMIYAAILLACTMSLPAQSKQRTIISIIDGNELYSWCSSPQTRNTLCAAYVSGVVDVIRHPLLSFEGRACMAREVSVDQLLDIVTRRLAANPQDRHNPASHLVFEAVRRAFPC
jgi:hypothetical protein